MSSGAAAADTFDVVVIGGGVNGTGAARDLALRGLSVALLEKTDLGAGATGASSGMIHGGARYLTHEPGVTKLSCTDAGAIRRIAGHMLFRIPFIMPSRKGIKTQGLPPQVATHFVEAFQYAYDLYQPRKGGLPHQRLNRREALAIEPGLSEQTVGAVTFDEWGIDAARLCAANALSAAAAGATVLTHFHATTFHRDDAGRLRAVGGHDTLTGGERTLRCRAVLNAAGPWGALVAREAGASLKLRPTKGVHVVLGGRVSNYTIAVFAIDGRAVFLEPWHDVTLVGTTDDDYYGDLDRPEATFDEVQYLLEAVGRFFPSIYDHRPIDTWVGVRPTLYQYGPNEDRVSRDHRVYDHREDGAEGLFTLAGGKLASYRLMAEEASDALCEHLGCDRPCKTAEEPLPGAEREVAPSEIRRWAADFDVPDFVVSRLVQRRGAGAEAILQTLDDEPDGREMVCRCEQVIAAELRHAIRHEWARTVGDLMRRTRMGTGPCGGHGCAHRAAEILTMEGVETPSDGARRFLSERLRSRRAVLRGVGARAEAIAAMDLAARTGGRPS